MVGMRFRALFRVSVSNFLWIVLAWQAPQAQTPALSSSSKSKPARRASSGADSSPDPGNVSNNVYHNTGFGFTCKIPAGWVLRTGEMNERDDDGAKAGGVAAMDSGQPGRVLLAAFSRPPLARAEDVNASILIAAESVASYPGLTDAAQYFGPVMEVAKAQGLAMDDELYEFPVSTKTLVRGDFQKNVGTRVLRQSTLVMLARGYAVSFTFIGGTEDEVEELVQGLSFAAAKTAH
jgi:hypothetical protein